MEKTIESSPFYFARAIFRAAVKFSPLYYITLRVSSQDPNQIFIMCRGVSNFKGAILSVKSPGQSNFGPCQISIAAAKPAAKPAGPACQIFM